MEKTIDDKIQDNEWKKAEDNLKHFDEMIELIKKYPVKSIQLFPFQPYTTFDIYYNLSPIKL